MPQTFTDVACTVCGCVCDDLQVTVSDGCVSNVRGACRIAEPWFAALAKPSTRPPATIDGQPVSLAEAIEHAAEILRSSRAPLIWGLTRSSTAGQRAAVALAEQVRVTVDTTTSLRPAATLAFQNVGQSTCTLGEVRNRADLVIFWNTDPATTNPRHLERYSVTPQGEFLPRGRADRTVVVIDSTPTETSRRADSFLQISADHALDVAQALRQLLSEPEASLTSDIGVTRDELLRLLDGMKSCRYGALFFGIEQGDTARDFAEAVLLLTRELNKSTRFTAHYIPKTGGLTGADNVLSWQTGFPFAVNFSLGYPRFNPNEYSANAQLESGNVDACVLVGSEGVEQLSPAARQALDNLPTIALDYPNHSPSFAAKVQFTTAIYGIHAPGTAYRMDGIPIPLRQLTASDFPTDDEVLNQLAARVKS